MAKSAEKLLRFCQHHGCVRERTCSEFFIETFRKLYPNTNIDLRTVVLRNSYVLDETVYLTGTAADGKDAIWQIQGNLDPERSFITFSAEQPPDRRLIGAFPLPASDGHQFWIASFEQPGAGIPNSLELIDIWQQQSVRRKVRFVDERGNQMPDLYCLWGKFDPTGRWLMLTRYGFAKDDHEEGGGEWIIDMVELTRIAEAGGNSDLVMPATRITRISHSFGQSLVDKSYSTFVKTPPPTATSPVDVYMPLIAMGNASISRPNISHALAWQKYNKVDTYKIPHPPTALIQGENIGLTTGWNPHTWYFSQNNRTYRILALTYPRTNMGYENISIQGVIVQEILPNGSYRYVDPSEL